MADVEQWLNILLGAGGTGGLGALYTVIRTRKKGKLDDEETLIKRLDNDNKDKDKQIDRLEKRDSTLRNQRERAWSQAARFRRQLISLGYEEDKLEKLVEFDD